MGNSSSKSSPTSADTSPVAPRPQDSNIPTRRPPKRKDSAGTAAVHSISRGHGAAPAASLDSSHATSQDRSSLSHSRGRTQASSAAQQRLQDIADDRNTVPSTSNKRPVGSATPDRSRSPLPLNVQSTADPSPEGEIPQGASSASTSVAALETQPVSFQPSTHYGRPPRLPLPIEEEVHAPGSPPTSPSPDAPVIDTVDSTAIEEPDEVQDGTVEEPGNRPVLSSTTLDDEEEEEDLNDDMYKAEDVKGPLINTLLEWREGGEKVYVTGTFCAWVKKSRLHKGGPSELKNAFSASLGLPPGTHHLIFFVDGVPRTSRYLPTAVDYAGSLVNYIEVPPEDTPSSTGTKDAANSHSEASTSPGKERRPTTGIHPPMVLPPRTPELKPAGTPSTAGKATSATAPAPQTQYYPQKQPKRSTAASLKRTQEEKKRYHAEIPRFLLDWDAPEGSSRVQRASAVMQTQPAPPSLPMFLTKSILSMATPMKDDASVLAYPNHTLLNHLATSSIKDEVLATSATTRYKSKFVTTIVYRPTTDETNDGNDTE